MLNGFNIVLILAAIAGLALLLVIRRRQADAAPKDAEDPKAAKTPKLEAAKAPKPAKAGRKRSGGRRRGRGRGKDKVEVPVADDVTSVEDAEPVFAPSPLAEPTPVADDDFSFAAEGQADEPDWDTMRAEMMGVEPAAPEPELALAESAAADSPEAVDGWDDGSVITDPGWPLPGDMNDAWAEEYAADAGPQVIGPIDDSADWMAADVAVEEGPVGDEVATDAVVGDEFASPDDAPQGDWLGAAEAEEPAEFAPPGDEPMSFGEWTQSGDPEPAADVTATFSAVTEAPVAQEAPEAQAPTKLWDPSEDVVDEWDQAAPLEEPEPTWHAEAELEWQPGSPEVDGAGWQPEASPVADAAPVEEASAWEFTAADMDVAPVAEAAPVVEAAPVAAPAPVAEASAWEFAAPDMDVAQVAVVAQVVESAPVAEASAWEFAAPDMDVAPVAEVTQVVESAPVAAPAPVAEASAWEFAAPDMDVAQVAEVTQVVESAPVAAPAAVAEAPAWEFTAADVDVAPVAEAAPVVEVAPVAEVAPPAEPGGWEFPAAALDVAPVPVAEAAPVAVPAPAVEPTPVVEAAPVAEAQAWEAAAVATQVAPPLAPAAPAPGADPGWRTWPTTHADATVFDEISARASASLEAAAAHVPAPIAFSEPAPVAFPEPATFAEPAPVAVPVAAPVNVEVAPVVAPVAVPVYVAPADVAPDDERLTGRFAIGGMALEAGHEALAPVAFRTALEGTAPSSWVRKGEGPAVSGSIVLSVEATMNCDPEDLTVMLEAGFAPTQDAFTLRLSSRTKGPFAASGTFWVVP